MSLACETLTGRYQCLYQTVSKHVSGYPSYGVHKIFASGGDNFIMKKKMRVVSLARDMPTGPPLHLYQILSYYLKQYSSYGLHKISASGEITI